MAGRPSRAGGEFHLGGDYGFFHSRTQNFQCPVEQLRAEVHRCADELQLVLVLDHPKPLDRGRSILEGNARRPQLGQALFIGDGDVLRLEPDGVASRAPAPSPPEISQCLQNGFPRNHNLGRFHLFMSLSVVTNVCEESALRFFDEKQPRAASKSAKISNVVEMADEKRVKAGGGEVLPELLLAR